MENIYEVAKNSRCQIFITPIAASVVAIPTVQTPQLVSDLLFEPKWLIPRVRKFGVSDFETALSKDFNGLSGYLGRNAC